MLLILTLYGPQLHTATSLFPLSYHADGLWQGFSSLTSSTSPTSKPANHQICILSIEVAGLDRESEIGAAVTNLALLLGGRGFAVTLVWANVLGSMSLKNKDWKAWKQWYAAGGVTLTSLPFDVVSQYMKRTDNFRSYVAYQWVLNHSHCQVLHFHDWKGLGFHTALAVQQRLHEELDHVTVATTLFSPEMWLAVGREQLPSEVTDLQGDVLERSSIEHADVALSPSLYMLAWMQKQKYKLPMKKLVFPTVHGGRVHPEHHIHTLMKIQPQRSRLLTRYPTEFVYLGGVQRWNGFFLFVKAAQRLQQQLEGSNLTVRITVAGLTSQQPDSLDAQQMLPYLLTLGWTIFTQLSLEDAVAYISNHSAVAVIPSLHENSPYRLLACLAAQLPVIASDVGGVAELISQEDREPVLIIPNVNSLLAKVLDVFHHGIRQLI